MMGGEKNMPYTKSGKRRTLAGSMRKSRKTVVQKAKKRMRKVAKARNRTRRTVKRYS